MGPMPLTTSKRWFTAIPLPYSERGAFWDRDMGLICLGLKEAGVDARFVALGQPGVHDDVPLVLGKLEDLQTADWWRQWNLDGVALASWAAPRYEPLARAIKQSGTRLVLKLDSNGTKAPHVDFGRYLLHCYITERDRGAVISAGMAFAKSLLFRMAPAVYLRPMLQHLSHADILSIESPIALQRMRRLLLKVGRPDLASRLRVCAHPAKSEAAYDPSVPKEKLIVAAGRWESFVKGAPLLMQVLGQTLAREPDYSAIIAGSGEEQLRALAANIPEAVRSRIQIVGRMDHASLCRLYLKCRVMVVSSWYESFHIASAEALCGGCSVVGPAEIPSMNWFASTGSGTVAVRRTARDMSDALGAELAAWQAGERDPAQISRCWRGRVTPLAVARRILGYFE